MITRVHRLVQSLATGIFDIIAPPLCAACKQFLVSREPLCISCRELIHPIASVEVPITQNHSLKVFALSLYREPIKSLILSKSSSNIVASNQLGELLWEMTHIRSVEFDYLVPVPLHWMRFAKRGFNQAEEMAKVISRLSGKPVVPSLVGRIKNTPFQSALIVSKREENVCDAFELTTNEPELYKNKHIMIVDDLMTTGSTLKGVARQLLKLKPASISAVVAARIN